MTENDAVARRLEEIPGVGPIFATAIRAAVADIHRFPTARHFASWLGLTAKENSSGEKRRLGGISKAGDVYLRTLLIHGARSVLMWGHVAEVSAHRVGDVETRPHLRAQLDRRQHRACRKNPRVCSVSR